MEPRSKRKKRRVSLSTTEPSYNETEKQSAKHSEESFEEYPDINEDYLDSVFKAARNVKIKPPVCTYTIKMKEAGLAAVDIKKFSDIAYVTCYSSEIHVLSCNKAIVSEKECVDEKRHIKCESENFEKVNTLNHSSDVTALSYANEHLLISCCLDGTVRAWDGNYKLMDSFSDVLKCPSDIHTSSRLDYFATSSLIGLNSYNGNTLYGAVLFSLQRKFPIMSFLGHTAGTQCVRFHPNGMYLATASEDNTIKMWSTQTSKLVRTFQDESQEFSHWRKITFSPDGKYLASTYYGYVKIWDVASGRLIKTLGTVNPNHIIHNICYSEFGEELAAGGTGGILEVWNVKDFSDGSYVANSDIELLDSHVMNQPIHKINCNNNIFSCVCVALVSQEVKSRRKKCKQLR